MAAPGPHATPRRPLGKAQGALLPNLQPLGPHPLHPTTLPGPSSRKPATGKHLLTFHTCSQVTTQWVLPTTAGIPSRLQALAPPPLLPSSLTGCFQLYSHQLQSNSQGGKDHVSFVLIFSPVNTACPTVGVIHSLNEHLIKDLLGNEEKSLNDKIPTLFRADILEGSTHENFTRRFKEKSWKTKFFQDFNNICLNILWKIKWINTKEK